MTDLFRGYDLTTVADKVTRAHYERVRETSGVSTVEWDELTPLTRHHMKADLLPLITQVLDALESDQVQPVNAKEMVQYRYDDRSEEGLAKRDLDRWYENQHPAQHDRYSATAWALHLHPRFAEIPRILERMSVLPETTGEYTAGDSWKEWGTPNADDLEDLHLVIYFLSIPERAAAVGQSLVTHAIFACEDGLHLDDDYDVSTAGDYAEILERP